MVDICRYFLVVFISDNFRHGRHFLSNRRGSLGLFLDLDNLLNYPDRTLSLRYHRDIIGDFICRDPEKTTADLKINFRLASLIH